MRFRAKGYLYSKKRREASITVTAVIDTLILTPCWSERSDVQAAGGIIVGILCLDDSASRFRFTLQQQGEKNMFEATRSAIELIAKTDNTITPEALTAAFGLLEGRTMSSNQRETERLLSVKETAEMLSIHEKYVWTILKKEDIPVVKLGKRCRRIRYSDLTRLINQRLSEQSAEHRTLPHEWHKAKEENTETGETTKTATEAREE
jgi:excisionase family DNA binding protein